MELLTSEPPKGSICVWFSNYTVLGLPMPNMVMVRIDQGDSVKRWQAADAYHTEVRFLWQGGIPWEEALERGKEFDGPYLLVPYEEK